MTDFLRENGFRFCNELGGSHQAWIKRGTGDKPAQIVEVNFTHRSYPLKTLKLIICKSGIDEDEWIKWGAS